MASKPSFQLRVRSCTGSRTGLGKWLHSVSIPRLGGEGAQTLRPMRSPTSWMKGSSLRATITHTMGWGSLASTTWCACSVRQLTKCDPSKTRS